MAVSGLKTRKPTGRVPWPCILLEGEEKSGKAQPLHARIATPTGWTTMGGVTVGDQVLGTDGHPTTVLAVHERGQRPVYRLTFSDGATVEACDEHLWAVHTANDRHRQYSKGPKKGQRNPRPYRVLTTAEVRERVLDGAVMHVPMTAPVEYDVPEPLPLDPYLLGLLLGDGGLTKPSCPVFTSGDEDLFDRLAATLPGADRIRRSPDGRSVGISGGATTAALRGLGLMGCGSAEKFIPAAYLVAQVADRLALLQGLMDTDGGMERRVSTMTTVSPQLAEGVRQLVESLGGTAATGSKQPFYVNTHGQRIAGKLAYRITVRLPQDMCPFRLSRKAEAWGASRPTFITRPIRTIREVEYVGTQPVRCITVAAEDHLYLTDHFVVTHNSWSLAQFSASDKIGTLYWIDLNEGAGDEYGAIPGTKYQLVEHDGSYAAVLAAVQAVKAEARRAADAGEPPVVLGIDTGSAIWDGLKDWASGRAATSARNRELLKRDPNAEITISQNLWNDAGARWRKLQTELLTFPGIVVVTARGKEVTEVDTNGRPVEGQKTWSVQTHREFPYAATVWVRLRRGHRPLIVGARSVHVGIKPNADPAKEVTDEKADGRLLEWLVFDALRCDPGTAHVRDLVAFHGGGLLDHERSEEAQADRQAARAGGRREPDAADLVARIGDAGDDDELREVWAEANRSGMLQVDVPTPGGSYTVAELIQARHEEFLEASMGSHPAGRRRAQAAAQAPAPETPAAVMESARAAAAAARPSTGREETPVNPLLEPSPTPDDPAERRLNAARRGVLASLEALGVTEERIGARFGRPAEQVATRRLTALVREVIATQRAGVAGQQEIVA